MIESAVSLITNGYINALSIDTYTHTFAYV